LDDIEGHRQPVRSVISATAGLLVQPSTPLRRTILCRTA